LSLGRVQNAGAYWWYQTILSEDITLSSLCLCILSSLCQYRAGAFNCRFRTKNASNTFPCWQVEDVFIT
jgi:hypothetical protein